MPGSPCEAGCTCRLHPRDNVTNEPFRLEVQRRLERGERAVDLASAAGMTRKFTKRLASGGEKTYEVGDSSTLLRMVGLRETTSKTGGRYTTVRKTVNPDVAMRLCHALDIDYTEAGI